MDNTCVSCGAIIPEGRQVCPNCEAVLEKYANKICKTCTLHDINKCKINIGLWKDDDYCSQWKGDYSNESNKN